MDRRQFLSTVTVAGVAAVAGCQALSGDSGNTGDTTEPTSTPDGDDPDPVVEWRKWVPAEPVQSETTASFFANDVATMLSEFPESAYTQFDPRELSDTYGIDESDMSWFLGFRLDGQTVAAILTGTIDPGDVIETLGVSADRVEEDGNYQVVDERIAVSDSALVLGTDYQTYTDVRAGEIPRLGDDDEDWKQLLTAVQDGTLIIVTEGAPPYHGSLDATKTGAKVSATGDGGSRTTEYLHFASADRAQTVTDERQDELVREARSHPDAELVSFERRDNRVVIVLEAPDFTGLS